MAGTLVATRYVPPGSYIGQLITPRPGQVAPEARLPCFIGRGSRLALGSNIPITRSFIFAEALTFSTNAPFVATLNWDSDGDQQTARLFKADGTEVRRDQWSFQSTGGGTNNQVLVNTEVYDSTVSYYLDYQSTSRIVTDTVPVEELREIVTLGNQVDKPQYNEFEHFFIETAVSTVAPDSGNANPDPGLGTITADGGNTGAGVVAFASSAEFAHNYTRSYEFEVTGQTVGVKATGSVTAVAGASLSDGELLVINDGVNPATTFEFNTGAAAAGNVLISYTGADADTVVAAAIQAAINGVGSTLLVTAAAPVGAVVNLEADNFGTAANQTITTTTSMVVTGMASGAAREIDCEWSADAVSPGNAAGYDTPLNAAASNPTFTVTDDTAASFTPLLEYGIRLEFDFGALADNQFDVGDTWTFWANGPGLFEPDARHANTNQYATIGTPVADAGNTGTAGTGVSVATTADFTGGYNANYQLEVTAQTNTAPGTRTTTFVWGEAGDYVGINGTFTADEATPASLTQTLSKGVIVDIDYPVGAGNFAVGDIFTIAAKAPRQLYQAKDSRTYTFTVSAATNPSAGEGYVQGTFVTDTPEGGFGTFEATGNDKLATDPDFEDGHFTLNDNILMAARNLFYDALTSGNMHAAADDHTFAATQAGTINWTLNEETPETIEADGILTDVNGSVTGTPGTSYVILSHTPIEVKSVVTLAGSTPVSYTHIAGTPYLTFLADPGEAIVATYEWRSAEPDPGQVYFLTAKFIRPDESYNTPILILERQDGRTALAPASLDNHLYIMNEIAWDNGVPGLYFIQVQDPDEDGVYTDADFNEAIIASEAPRRITDIIVLSQFTSLGAALNSVNRMNDPFERRERLCWVGMPIGTPIGDADTPDTIVYTARNTLQVYGNNPAHGTRIIVGSTQATRDIRLDDGTTVTATVDGSFVAGALASLVASFQDPGETVLRKTLGGFNTLETYGDIEDPRNLTLGAAQVVFMTDQGGSVFRIEEDETVDTFADDFKAINAMTQKQFVTKNIRTQVDQSLVGIVVPSAQAGVGLVKGFVVGAVNGLVTRGVVGRFQDDNGNERSIDPDADVVVFRDETDVTLYHFFYAYWLKTVVKRLFGLFSVNSNDFGLLRG
jgi:hypothetical protein